MEHPMINEFHSRKQSIYHRYNLKTMKPILIGLK